MNAVTVAEILGIDASGIKKYLDYAKESIDSGNEIDKLNY